MKGQMKGLDEWINEGIIMKLNAQQKVWMTHLGRIKKMKRWEKCERLR